MLKYLAFPAIAALIAVAIAGFPFAFPLPYADAPSPLAALMVGAAIFFLLLAMANHVVATRLFERMRGRLKGLDDFDADLRRRIGGLEAEVERLQAETERLRDAPAAIAPVLADEPDENDDDEEDANVIAFDPEARLRQENRVPTARPAGARLANALERDVIHAWFQPVVTLPGRTTRFLDASPHMAVDEADARGGRLIEPGYANAPEIDRRMLMQSLTLLRELDRSDKALGVIWTVHARLLGDRAAFKGIKRILEANVALTDQLVVRINHRDYLTLEDKQIDRLHRIRELGFRMALGQCPVPPTNIGAVQSGLFSVLFMDADRLIANWLDADTTRSASHDAAVGDAEIIARGVTTEEQAIALIDLDILLAQGDFFSEPRPLRRPADDREAAEN